MQQRPRGLQIRIQKCKNKNKNNSHCNSQKQRSLLSFTLACALRAQGHMGNRATGQKGQKLRCRAGAQKAKLAHRAIVRTQKGKLNFNREMQKKKK